MGSAGRSKNSALGGAQKCLCNIRMYYKATLVTKTQAMLRL
jgi:hypothetical protein